jgi:hypothetical protein
MRAGEHGIGGRGENDGLPFTSSILSDLPIFRERLTDYAPDDTQF